MGKFSTQKTRKVITWVGESGGTVTEARMYMMCEESVCYQLWQGHRAGGVPEGRNVRAALLSQIAPGLETHAERLGLILGCHQGLSWVHVLIQLRVK